MRQEETELYKKLKLDSKGNGDRGSCTVLSSCVAFDLTYQQGYNFMMRYADRKKGKGVGSRALLKAYPQINKFLGVEDKFEVKHYDQTNLRKKFTRGATMTVNNCTQYLHPNKRYIILVSRHALGVKNNVVHDWTRGRKHPVEDVIEITCKAEWKDVKPKSKTFKVNGFASVLANL